MKIKIWTMFSSVTFAAILLLPSASRADFFKYKDSDGNLTITNRLEDVPEKYRKKVKVVWDKDLDAKDSVARKRAAAKEQFEKRESTQKAQQEAEEKMKASTKGKTLVIDFDENTGQLIRHIE